jgi:hypothetical protein
MGARHSYHKNENEDFVRKANHTTENQRTMPLLATPKGTPIAPDAMQKRIEELEAQLAAKNPVQPLKFKVSEKGGLSVYNVNARFPVTLYAGQWERLLDAADAIRAFIKANESRLSRK